MSSPLLDGERQYVVIIQGDRFPCGSRPWVQLAIGLANHGQKARTLAYNWSIDGALTSGHDIDALCAIFFEDFIGNPRYYKHRMDPYS